MSEIKSIAESKSLSYALQGKELVKNIFTLDWIFSQWYEKLIISASFLYAFIKLILWIKGLF